MNAYQNIVEGMKALEQERLEKQAYFRNEEEKQAREMKEQQASADAPPEATQEELQEQLHALQKAIADVTSKIKGDA